MQTKSNKNKVSKKLQEFINSIANVGKSNIPGDDCMIYYSKIDGAYLTRVGMEKPFREFLKEKELLNRFKMVTVNQELVVLGSTPIEQKMVRLVTSCNFWFWNR